MSLANLLRSARTEQGLDQVKIAEFVGVSQSTVSAWENGTQTPTAKYHDLLAQALAMGAPTQKEERRRVAELKESIASAARASRARPRKSKILSAREYLKQQQIYLEALGTQSSDIRVTFLGPEYLPVLDPSSGIEQVWVKNLVAGVDYVLIWFLCMVEAGSIRRRAERFRAIGNRVVAMAGESSHGTIHHLGLRLLDLHPDSMYQTNKKDFEECGKIGFSANKWHSHYELEDGIKRRLLRQHIPHGSMAIYYHERLGMPRLAGVNMQATRTAPESSEETAFHFLGRDQTDALYDLLEALFDETNHTGPRS